MAMTPKELEAQRVVMEIRKVETAKMAQLIRIEELRQETERVQEATIGQDKRIAELHEQLRAAGIEPPPPMPMFGA